MMNCMKTLNTWSRWRITNSFFT